MPLPRKKLALGGCATTLLFVAAGLLYLHHLLLDRTPGQYFDSNGTKIHYTTEGNDKADPVILIHGLAAQADINWRAPGINALLAPDFKVVAFDLRGHGLSDHPHDPARYGIDTVEDITRLMDHLHIQKAHLAGYSLGGFLALKFAVLHPERCISLEICASGWKDPDDMEPLRSPYRDNPETRLAPNPKKHQRLFEKMKAAAPTARLEIPQTPGLPAPLEAGILPDINLNFDAVRDYFGDQVVDREAMRALKDSLGYFSVTAAELQALKVPTLCLIGTKDGLKPYALDLKKAMPATELIEIPGANHITTVMYAQFQSTLQHYLLTHRLTKP